MSVVEEQAKEFGVGAAGGAKDGGQERETMIGIFLIVGGLYSVTALRETTMRGPQCILNTDSHYTTITSDGGRRVLDVR